MRKPFAILLIFFGSVAWAGAESTQVIGHRGMGEGHSPEPENSLPALGKAFELGANAVEFDVQLSADHEVVLAHDPRLERMTDGRGCVADRTLAQLRRLRLKDGQGTIHPDLGVSTLAEALELIRRYDSPERAFLADIHIKVYDGFHGDMSGLDNGGCLHTDYARLTASVLRLVREAGLLERVIFTSFDTRVLDQIKLELPAQRVGLLTWMGTRHAIHEAQGRYEFVALNSKHFTRADVALAHSLGLSVLVWSPSEAADLMTESNDGVDAWITDNVPIAVSLARRDSVTF